MAFRSIKSLLVKTFSVFSLLIATQAFAGENHVAGPAQTGTETPAAAEAIATEALEKELLAVSKPETENAVAGVPAEAVTTGDVLEQK